MDDEGKVQVDFLSNLRRHSATVNVCRFSPDGKYLATGADDQLVFLWKLSDVVTPANNIFSDEDADNKETWVIHKTLRGHLGDVLDLCWSQDGRFIVSGSVDNSAIAWDTQKDLKLAIFTDHKSFVQGVAWDPLREYMATLSSDRSLRIFNVNSKHCMHNVSKMVPRHLTPQEGNKPKAIRIYHDDTLRSFFRRLAFSPDGQLLITPAGIVETSEGQRNATYIFIRGYFKEPAVCLPSTEKATVAVRVCPLLFQLRPVLKQTETGESCNGTNDWEKYSTIFSLPYRIVFAVATETEVVVYDTQQTKPFGYLTNIHYHTLSDLAWSSDGRVLVVSSTDGYCSVITFDKGELGMPYTPRPAMSVDGEAKSPVETVPVENILSQQLSVSLTPTNLEQMEVDGPPKIKNTEAMQMESTLTPAVEPVSPALDASLAAEMKTIAISPPSVTVALSSPDASAKQPKRIQLTTISLNKPK